MFSPQRPLIQCLARGGLQAGMLELMNCDVRGNWRWVWVFSKDYDGLDILQSISLQRCNCKIRGTLSMHLKGKR